MKRYITKSEYMELWEKCQNNRLYETPPWTGISEYLKNTTVRGLSGKGTKYANELERKKDEYYNPPMPLFIQMHTVEGIEYIYPERSK